MGNLVFIIFIIWVLIFSYLAEKKNNKKFLFIVVFILTFLAGFRGLDVGIDTILYNYAFENSFPFPWQFEEMGFRFISNTIMSIIFDSRAVFSFFALITNLFIVLRLWSFKKSCSFLTMMFIYCLTFFTDSMNVMRQFVAVAILFYSTKLLENKRFILFFLIVLSMTFIHRTSLLGLVLIIPYFWNSLSTSKKIIIIFPLIILSFLILGYVTNFESAHISNYLSDSNMIFNINLTFLYRIGAFILSLLLYISNKKIVYKKQFVKSNYNEQNIKIKDFNTIIFIYFLGLIFSSIGMFYVVMSRLGFYTVIFELVYWGYLVKSSKNKTFNFGLIAIYVVYIFIFEMITGGNGVFPFSFNI